MIEQHDPRDIVTTRLVDATREQVFRAYEEPQRLARWWSADGFRSTFERPARIVLERISQPRFVLTMTLVPEIGRTRITWRQRFETPEIRDELAPACVRSNEQNLDRLEAELARIND
jgi:hypothetical protein